MTGETPHDREHEDDGLTGAERWLLPYFEDMGLWPVLLVLLLHAAAILGYALSTAIRDRWPPAILGGLILLFLSYRAVRWEQRVRGGLRAFTWTIVATWIASVAIAVAGVYWGFL